MSSFAMQKYMTGGVLRVVRDSLRAVGADRREAAFWLRYAVGAAAASAKRFARELTGEHVPPFLIASITGSCNLHCAGCYARENHACSDSAPADQLTAEEWDRVFTEAGALGIGFILLAGGEPLLRWDVIKKAAEHPGVLFPIFTNGVCLGGQVLETLDAKRNLVPVISLEGDEEETDRRRGKGVYRQVSAAMDALRKKGIAFGVSITVTKENVRKVYSDRFLDSLAEKGCRAVIFVEYVPAAAGSDALAPGDEERAFILRTTARLRKTKPQMAYINFPGDEKSSGGCVAAGRGFFHVNVRGGAEPCPFSPYSDVNVRDAGLRGALKSPLFTALKAGGVLTEDHAGGCTLFERRETVEALTRASQGAEVNS